MERESKLYSGHCQNVEAYFMQVIKSSPVKAKDKY